MDNAVDALHIAFVALVLIIALSVAVYMITLARQTSEMVFLSADDTAYLSYEKAEKYIGISSENRIVGFETIIPTLFKYNFERYAVVFLEGTLVDGVITVAEPVKIYETDSNISNWDEDAKFVQYSINNDVFDKSFIDPKVVTDESKLKSVCTFDITEEGYRNECWVGSPAEIKKHLEAILFGDIYIDPSTNKNKPEDQWHTLDYTMNNKLHDWYESGSEQFVEFIGHYTTTEPTEEEEDDDEYHSPIHKIGNKTTSKTVIVYVHLN